jgi:hypothetical protein
VAEATTVEEALAASEAEAPVEVGPVATIEEPAM